MLAKSIDLWQGLKSAEMRGMRALTSSKLCHLSFCTEQRGVGWLDGVGEKDKN
jgi:hypothetical protein